jgi:hypothetical protein
VGPVEKKENLVGSVECFVFVAKFRNLVGEFFIRNFLKHHKIVIFSGGRPEASKRNVNFQGATWHHLKHLQSKDIFQSIIIFSSF